MWFYRHFGANVDPSKIDQVRLCDYNNANKIKFCAPAFDHQAPMKNPNLHIDTIAYGDSKLSFRNRSSFTSIPSRCLEDPDDTKCRNLRTLIHNDTPLPGITSMKINNDLKTYAEVPTSAPNTYATHHSFLTPMPSAPVGATASFSPTRYMCYGNHDSFKQANSLGDEMTNVRGKWCESEMPSVSLEPSGSPIVFPKGGVEGYTTEDIIKSLEPTGAPIAFPKGGEEGEEKVEEITSLEPSGSPIVFPKGGEEGGIFVPTNQPTPKPFADTEKPSEVPTDMDWSGPPGLRFKFPAESSTP
eukprot:CAMPEP_0197186964 /NCGR_PEP_ID=MMETSP1423-20130617/14950_1 /TAXON_ID=476441 /ORGANISM="Pseudo-nitzschia heimii, Strain UNC1101" /LENGTH=299 /DNA_ID=CAMNT_0042638413 /DNA_START=226 /DNA_END=1122 /DNA_ORIENTATION=+